MASFLDMIFGPPQHAEEEEQLLSEATPHDGEEEEEKVVPFVQEFLNLTGRPIHFVKESTNVPGMFEEFSVLPVSGHPVPLLWPDYPQPAKVVVASSGLTIPVLYPGKRHWPSVTLQLLPDPTPGVFFIVPLQIAKHVEFESMADDSRSDLLVLSNPIDPSRVIMGSPGIEYWQGAVQVDENSELIVNADMFKN